MSHRILYVIRHLDTGLHKIGITNDWGRRQRELEVGTKTAPVHVVRVNDARQIERFLHRRFKANRMPQSEWFNLSATQLEFVRTTVLKARDGHQHQGQPSVAPPTLGPAKTQPEPALVHRPRGEQTQTPAPAPAQTPRQVSGTPDWVTEGLDAVGAISFATVAMVVLLSPLFIWMNSAEKKAQQERQETQRLAELQEQNKQAVLDQAKKAEAEAAQQAEAEQEAARKEEEAIAAAAAEERAAIRQFAWALQKAEANDCRFYVWAKRAGDPDTYLATFSALPDANSFDDAECGKILNTSIGSAWGTGREVFIRDKLLRERGQMPPERKRFGANTAYRLDWPAAQ